MVRASCIIVAAGASSRFGADKMFSDILGMPLIWHTVSAFAKNPHIAEIIVCASEATRPIMKELFAEFPDVFVTVGGETRTQSVVQGLRLIKRDRESVVIHDGARPYVSQELIDRTVTDSAEYGSAVPVITETDTVYLYKGAGNPHPLNREEVMRVQTPQAFDFRTLMVAYQNYNGEATDDSAVYYRHTGKLHFVEGDRENVKVTFPSDKSQYRVGCGIDVHRLTVNRELILGGVKIPYEKGLLGHSDADVLTHAVMDALLSAAGQRDIGVQFPDTDEQYRGVSSMALLYKVCRMLEAERLTVVNVSAVITAQKPKLMDFLPQMSENLALVMKIPSSRVNLTATTTENLGMLGAGDGIAVQAYCLLR